MTERKDLTTEQTEQGEQILVPGVCPVSQRQRLEALIAMPLLPKKRQKPAGDGLFDLGARNQLNLF